MSEEGEGSDEVRKDVVSENEGDTLALSGEAIMESVGIPEEEVKFNNLVPAPHIIYSSSLFSPFFPQVSNPSAEDSNKNVSGKREGTDEVRTLSFCVRKGGRHNSFIYRCNDGVS